MPTTKAVTKRYCPALSEMITVDDLPEFLHFAENGLNFLEYFLINNNIKILFC
ncbi:hypothetical protein N824_02505 [Pedobacter sp. V48]|nr:hypothetical protein N824_02505 [Pedobacter sp. V48]